MESLSEERRTPPADLTGTQTTASHQAQAATQGKLRINLATLLIQAGLVVLVILLSWAGFQTDTPMRIPAISSTPGLYDGIQNLEESEAGIFRWTDGAGEVCVPHAGSAARSLVTTQISGAYALPLGIETATLRPGTGPGVTIALPPQPRHYTLLTGGDQQAGADLCLTIESPTVVDPNNNRTLGVQFFRFTGIHLPMAGPVTPALSQIIVNLALALAAFWLMRLLRTPAWVAGVIVAGGIVAYGKAVAIGLVPAGPGVVRMQVPVALGLLGGVAGLVGRKALARYAPPMTLLQRDLLGMTFWSIMLVGGINLVQRANGHHSVWPLKAGVYPDPYWTWLVILPTLLFVGWLWLVMRLSLQGARMARLGAALVMLGAVLIPVALEVTVLGHDSLYEVFRDSEYDYQQDTWRVTGDPIGFLGRYVEEAPDMALHNSNHPPGSVLLLWGVEQIFGPGAVATSWLAIILSALSAAAALWLGWKLGGPRLALVAGAIYVAMPGHLVYSVTSMDGVFNALNALTAVAFFFALERNAKPWMALLAGGLAALGVFFSYVATQLFFFGVAAVILSLIRAWHAEGRPSLGPLVRHMLRQSALAGVVLVSFYLLIYLVSGFNIIEASREATAINAPVVGKQLIEGPVEQAFLPPNFAFYVKYLGANIGPYFWYLAPWGMGAFAALIIAGSRRLQGREPLNPFDLVLLSTAFCVLGMWVGGLFNREVERIWGFTYPLLAVVLAHYALQGEARQRQWRAWLFPLLFFAQGAVIKMLLNTAW
ncbi:glycosyltransferase family 39 protein [Candidatus Chloroploca asiatica]|uniref:Uncharacterized protein n=1 Tax=Candidatus Chloroploca asiatica TaxID=1506545 RepID=A0A2H3KGR4_9CHLR|nr:glycosyltransferase family 39 protein [Candidatus Chloroploca asiatica]PDV96923.1 hypothetical protein A9Q02_19770 [Candidatus Chloroploca asiatica]